METHLSLDIETLDVDPSNNAAVIAVGAVAFNREAVIDSRLWLLDPRLSPGTRSASTFKWWMEQDYSVLRDMWGGSMPPWEFCSDFSSFVGMNAVDWAWGYPARFDLGHLRSLYRAMEQPFPINFRQERDLSTLRWVMKQSARIGGPGEWDVRLEEIKAQRVEHNALDDAMVQARQIQASLIALEIY